VPLARDLHPEFGYVGSGPRVFRRIGTVLAFAAFGIVAAASGMAVFMATPDAVPGASVNPLDAMALAPADALFQTKPVLPTQPKTRPANAPAVEKTGSTGARSPAKAGTARPTCRESLAELREADCTPVRIVRVRRFKAVNERPLIAAVPIGHLGDPALLPAPPPAPAAVGPSPPVLSEKSNVTAAPIAVAKEAPAEAAPAETVPAKAAPAETVPAKAAPAETVPAKAAPAKTAPTKAAPAEAAPADPAPAVVPIRRAPTPAIAAKKSRPQVRHAEDESRTRRRNPSSYASSSSGRSSSYGSREGARSWSYSAPNSVYLQAGYARVW